MINRAPQIVQLSVDLDVHLIKVPPPVPGTPHPANLVPADVRCKQRPEAIPPKPHRLMTQADTTLKKQILDVPQ